LIEEIDTEKMDNSAKNTNNKNKKKDLISKSKEMVSD
jgi:hypothetical protein